MRKIVILAVVVFSMFVIPRAYAMTYNLVEKLPGGEYAIAVGWSESVVSVHTYPYMYLCNFWGGDTVCQAIYTTTSTTEPDGIQRWITTDTSVEPWLGVQVYSYPIAKQKTVYELGDRAYSTAVVVGSIIFAIVLIRWILVFASRLARW